LVGIPTLSSHNGRMMETSGGASLLEMWVRDGPTIIGLPLLHVPMLGPPDLTVLTHALVTRVIFDQKRPSGVEVVFDNRAHRINAGSDVVLCLGAIHTPKVLMQSGIGDEVELRRWAIPVGKSPSELLAASQAIGMLFISWLRAGTTRPSRPLTNERRRMVGRPPPLHPDMTLCSTVPMS
jgi:choline dehydrogenase-like flavoprotein